MDEAAKDHAGILKGIQKKDILRCTEVISEHILGTGDEIIRCLSGKVLDNLNDSLDFILQASIYGFSLIASKAPL